MLEVGNGGMSYNEYQTHFALWSIMKSPLILGNDLSKLDDQVMSIIANDEVISVNQDTLGIQGTLKYDSLLKQTVYAVSLANGDVAAVIVNFNYWNIYNVKVNFNKLGLKPKTNYKIRDLWAKKDLGTFQDIYTIDHLASHASMFLKFIIA